ncbi:MAG TPA: hypothetical protein VL738_37025 [Dactylosporangium sp.]|jgi:hypothetical protein|nr:hypothetical protein [Dactylosporangium sp.]
MDSYSAFGDLDGDHVVDTQAVDVNGDGHFDVQYTDTNHDSVADVMLVDTTGDGIADVQVFSDQHGGGVVMEDYNADGVADVAYTVGPFDTGGYSPQVETGYADAGPFPADTGLTGDTAAVLNSVNSQMSDASVIYHDAMNPGSVDPNEVDAAMQRADNAAQNAQQLQGYTYQQQVSNDIHQGDLDRQYSEQAHQQATDAYIDSDRAADQADWAVWNSQQERGA